MAEELATATYSISEPFEQAVRSLRKVLADGNLKLAGELDMCNRFRQRLLIGTDPCRVLFVTARAAASGEWGADPYAAALSPLHIVVSGRGLHTEIHLLRPLPGQNGPRDQTAMAAFRQLQARTAQAVERIGMRSNLVA